MAEIEKNMSSLVAGRDEWTKRAEYEHSEADLAGQVLTYLTDPEPAALIKAYIERKRAKAESFRKLAYAAAQAIEGLQRSKSADE